MKILTWNVLHRVHAETHREPAVERWPDETARLRGVVDLIANALERDGFEVVLLQEVSGDVLAALRVRLPAWSVIDHVYPRVAKQRAGSCKDPKEHLVVVAPIGSKVVRAQTFESDPGKGFLMVGLPKGLTVITTHVSWGAKGAAQLAVLSTVLGELQTPACLGGDFNAPRESVARAAGKDVTFAGIPPGSPRTRPQGDDGEDIDHLLAKHAVLSDVSVLEHHELSDHRPVAARITVPSLYVNTQGAPGG